jgi:hypothetical protein
VSGQHITEIPREPAERLQRRIWWYLQDVEGLLKAYTYIIDDLRNGRFPELYFESCDETARASSFVSLQEAERIYAKLLDVKRQLDDDYVTATSFYEICRVRGFLEKVNLKNEELEKGLKLVKSWKEGQGKGKVEKVEKVVAEAEGSFVFNRRSYALNGEDEEVMVVGIGFGCGTTEDVDRLRRRKGL